MSESRPLRMTMLRVIDMEDDAAPRMTMFRTLAAPPTEQVAARGSSTDLRAALRDEEARR